MVIKEIISRIIAGLLSVIGMCILAFCFGVVSKIIITFFKWGYRIVL